MEPSSNNQSDYSARSGNPENNQKSQFEKIKMKIYEFFRNHKKYIFGAAFLGLVLLAKYKFYDKLVPISDAIKYIKN